MRLPPLDEPPKGGVAAPSRPSCRFSVLQETFTGNAAWSCLAEWESRHPNHQGLATCLLLSIRQGHAVKIPVHCFHVLFQKRCGVGSVGVAETYRAVEAAGEKCLQSGRPRVADHRIAVPIASKAVVGVAPAAPNDQNAWSAGGFRAMKSNGRMLKL